MPVWAFVPIVLAAFVACPVSMWVMSKVMRRRMSCAMCDTGSREGHSHNVKDLEARKAGLEQEIAAIRTEAQHTQVTDTQVTVSKVEKG